MKQAMINWSNSLADKEINTVHSVIRGGYQYYASAPQPMACQQGCTLPCYQQPGSSANSMTPACFPLGIPNQAITSTPGNLSTTASGFIPKSMASINGAIQAQQFRPCLVTKFQIPNFFPAPAWRLKSRRNKKTHCGCCL